MWKNVYLICLSITLIIASFPPAFLLVGEKLLLVRLSHWENHVLTKCHNFSVVCLWWDDSDDGRHWTCCASARPPFLIVVIFRLRRPKKIAQRVTESDNLILSSPFFGTPGVCARWGVMFPLRVSNQKQTISTGSKMRRDHTERWEYCGGILKDSCKAFGASVPNNTRDVFCKERTCLLPIACLWHNIDQHLPLRKNRGSDNFGASTQNQNSKSLHLVVCALTVALCACSCCSSDDKNWSYVL